MKKLGTSIIVLFMLLSLSGQEFSMPDLSNYQHNWMFYNPAFAGSREMLSWNNFYRRKPGEAGGPTFLQLSMHTPSKSHEKLAHGGYIYITQDPSNAFLGSSRGNEASFAYTFVWRTRTNFGKLALGISPMWLIKGLDLSGLNMFHQSGDNVLGSGGSEELDVVNMFNVGTGALFYTEDYFIGLSVPRILSLNDAGNYDANFTKIKPILSGGYEFFRSNKNFTLNPTFFVEYNRKRVDYAGSLNFGFMDEALWLGAIYKSSNMLSFNFNINITNKIMLGYAVDWALDPEVSYFHLTHELVFRYEARNVVKTNIPFYY